MNDPFRVDAGWTAGSPGGLGGVTTATDFGLKDRFGQRCQIPLAHPTGHHQLPSFLPSDFFPALKTRSYLVWSGPSL